LLLIYLKRGGFKEFMSVKPEVAESIAEGSASLMP